MNITTSELLEAVRSATGAHMNPDDAYTVAEISEAMGNSRQLTCQKLARLKTAGLLEILRAPREDLGGRMQMVPAYRFRAKAKKR